MSRPLFFGYGSLVNVDTFPEPWPLRPATLRGWRRVWTNYADTPSGPVISLSIEPAAGAAIDGALLRPESDAAAAWLDAREAGYEKIAIEAGDLTAADGLDLAAEPALRTYKSLSPSGRPAGAVITLSYVDAVLQGFLRLFGPEGARRFVETTGGWDAPIEDDRAAPRYPRAIRLSPEERDVIDSLVHEAVQTAGHGG